MKKTKLWFNFFGWIALTMFSMTTIIGLYFLFRELDKDECSWFNRPLKILDELAV